MKHHPLRYVIVVGIVMLLFTVGIRANVFAQEGETVYITSPTDGEIVSGLITITGAADFPDFQKYEIFLKTGNQLIWAATTYAPVINGNLAHLDTRVFIDGIYQIIIRQVHTDSNYTDFAGPTITIENNLGAPLPYPEIESSLLYAPKTGAVARIRNCSGKDLEFDYKSPQPFCSAADLWIMPKEQDSPTCPFVDALLIPCEYRGTAQGLGEPLGATYSFIAEAGGIYEIIYAGGSTLYIAEIEGDERASTDTGGLDPGDPARLQPPPEPAEDSEEATEAAVPTIPTAAPTPPPAVTAPTASVDDSTETEAMLPVSGHGTESNTPFVVVASGLILFLIVGGIVATRKRGYPS